MSHSDHSQQSHVEPERDSESEAASPWVKRIHVAIVVLLLGGGGLYWALKPPALNPMADLRAAEAMALVQTHGAKRAPTLLQAVNERVKQMRERGQGVRLGEWRVEKDGESPDRYLVITFIREQGFRDWFEREYVWRVNLKRKSVEPLSMAAEDLMPLNEVPPNPLAPPTPTN